MTEEGEKLFTEEFQKLVEEKYADKDELRELIEKWREAQRRREEDPHAHPIQAQVLGRCAGELEELVDGGEP